MVGGIGKGERVRGKLVGVEGMGRGVGHRGDAEGGGTQTAWG